MRTLRAFIFIALLCLTVLACGRKGSPVWLKPDELPAPTYINAYYRDGGVSMNWDYSPELIRHVKYFAVERKGAGGFEEFFNSKALAFSDPTGGGYAYRVVAVGGDAKGSNLNYSPIVAPPDSGGLVVPEGLKAKAYDEGVELSWRAEGVDGHFNVYKKAAQRGKSVNKPINAAPIKGRTYMDKRFDPLGGSVSYVVRAVTVESSEGVSSVSEGPASEPLLVWGEIYTPRAPAGVDITSSGGKVLVYWNENPEKWLVGYRVYRSLDGGAFKLLGQTRPPAFKDVPPGPGQYSYSVRALGPGDIEGPPGKTVRINLDGGKK